MSDSLVLVFDYMIFGFTLLNIHFKSIYLPCYSYNKLIFVFYLSSEFANSRQ